MSWVAVRFTQERTAISHRRSSWYMGIWRRLGASWTLYWTLTGAILASALAAGLATAAGRLHLRAGLGITAGLLLCGAVACQPLPARWLRWRTRRLVLKGFELGRRGRSEEAIAAYNEFLARWGRTGRTEIDDLVALALVNKASRLQTLGRFEEAIGAYDQVLDRFDRASRPDVLQQVARALEGKGVALAALDRLEEALRTVNEVARRFGQATEPGLAVMVARTAVNSGLVLGRLDRPEEQIAVYDKVIDRFGQAADLDLRAQVARSLSLKVPRWEGWEGRPRSWRRTRSSIAIRPPLSPSTRRCWRRR